ncbi:MAG: methionine synthase [Magnetospirillum sp.]|nr:methionine synthase [Magnetospirillum sp.]
MLFPTTLAGSLPKPGWLAETHKLWPKWRQEGAELARAKRDATLLWLKIQEDAGIDCVTEGEQSRQHFVHGFVEYVDGIDTEHKVTMGIRNNRYEAVVPQVVAPLKLRGRAHEAEAKLMRKHTKRQIRITLPGPMTIMDTVKDAHYGDRVKTAMAFADLLNAEARALEKDGVDVVQFDEPAFNAYTEEAAGWGIEALHRALDGLTCKTAVHICYGYGIKANIDWKLSLGSEWRQYEAFFPALAKSRVDQVALECMHSRVPPSLMALLAGKEVIVGAIDVATDLIETPEEIADMVDDVLKYVPKDKLILGTNCGLAPLDCDVAMAKLEALGKGAALARRRHA